jgi:hypothetical protein
VLAFSREALAAKSKHWVFLVFFEGFPFGSPFHVNEMPHFMGCQAFQLALRVPLLLCDVFQPQKNRWLAIIRCAPPSSTPDADVDDENYLKIKSQSFRSPCVNLAADAQDIASCFLH